MKNTVFHKAEIGGFLFVGMIAASGPHVIVSRNGHDLGDVALGVGNVCRLKPVWPGHDGDTAEWHLTKYRIQPRACLRGFGTDDVERLRAEFGITPSFEEGKDEIIAFLDSKAFVSLAGWVSEHPRIAARMAPYEAYIPRWHEKALAMAASRAAVAMAPLAMGTAR